jgi:hypothetical protein
MTLPPPPPPLWAPRLRSLLTRACKALKRALAGQSEADRRWRAAYTEWWHEYGWQIAADTPQQAWDRYVADRNARASTTR